MKILITGSDGQLGTALRTDLKGHSLIPLGDADVDITDDSQVRDLIQRHAPDVVVNAAAYTDVDGAETDQTGAFNVNEGGARNLARATVETAIPLLHVSTDYVFDGRIGRPYHEDDIPNPRSVYGASKLAGEEAVRAINPKQYIVRTAWLYHTVGRNFPKTMLSLASRDAPRGDVRVVDDQRGSPTYAPHLARAIDRLLATGAFGTYHLAGHGEASWFELTQTLYRLMKITTPVIPVTTSEFPRAAERPPYSVLATRRDPKILLPPWQEGLSEFVLAIQGESG